MYKEEHYKGKRDKEKEEFDKILLKEGWLTSLEAAVWSNNQKLILIEVDNILEKNKREKRFNQEKLEEYLERYRKIID